MVREENSGKFRQLNSDEEVVASYLMKLYGYQIQCVTVEDLIYLTELCAMTLVKEIHPDCVTVCDKNIAHVVNMLDERQEESDLKGSVWSRPPVVCYRCKVRGHIAKGCKHFKCFRWHEVGHTVIGCRKRRSDASPSTSRQSVSSTGHGDQTDCAAKELFVSHKCSLPSSSALSGDVPQESEADEDDADHEDDADFEAKEDEAAHELDSSQGGGCSDCDSLGMNLQLDCVSDDEDLVRDCDVGDGDRSDAQDKDSECGITCGGDMDSEEQGRPCWTYLSDVVGDDTSDMCLRDFLDYLESDCNTLGCVEQAEILSIIQEEKSDIHSDPYLKYWYMYQ